MMSTLADELVDKSWCEIKGFASTKIVCELRQHLLELEQEGKFVEAHTTTKSHDGTKFRTDKTCWLTAGENPATNSYFLLMKQLQEQLREELYLPITRTESLFAVYESGGYYQRHIDQPKKNGSRIISTVLYLNESWQTGDGGELFFYDQFMDKSPSVIIEPKAGNLIVFKSDVVIHEIVPSSKRRLSLATWYGRG